MATGSKGGRSYSDPSYGSVKVYTFPQLTAGTRATGIAQAWQPMNPITVVDWQITNNALGTGGSSQWVLAATSANGTAALGTIIFVGTHAAGAEVAGSAIDCRKASGTTWIIEGADTSVATVKVQGKKSESATLWYDVATVSVVADGASVTTVDAPHPFLRANVTAYTSGDLTVSCLKWINTR